MRGLWTVLLVLGACVGPYGDAAVEWPPVASKADEPDSAVRGVLVVAEAVEGVDLAPRERWTVDLAAGAAITVEVTRSGTSAGVDVALALYGPMGSSGGRALIASDDDAGYGLLPRLTATAAVRGEYLVVVARKSPAVARYRLMVTCAAGACAALPAPCDPETLAIMRLCARESTAGSPYDAAIECGRGQSPRCADALLREAAYEDCVLGSTWYEVRRSPWVVIVAEDQLDAMTYLDETERARVVRAVQASSHSDVTSSAEAFARVDDNIIDRYQLADVSTDRRLVAYIYGAGDNTYGAVFDEDDQAIDIHDGDITGCDLPPGGIRVDCGSRSDCGPQLQCRGITAEAGDLGVCGRGASRQVVCRGPDCTPAWLERRLDDLDDLPLGELPVERELIAYGLGERVIAVEVSLSIEHDQAGTMQVYLVDPSGAEQRVTGGVPGTAAIELTTTLHATGPANGIWRLRLEGQSGVGVLHRWSLRITTE